MGTVLLLMYRRESEPPADSNEPLGTGIPLITLGSSAREHVHSLRKVLRNPLPTYHYIYFEAPSKTKRHDATR